MPRASRLVRLVLERLLWPLAAATLVAIGLISGLTPATAPQTVSATVLPGTCANWDFNIAESWVPFSGGGGVAVDDEINTSDQQGDATTAFQRSWFRPDGGLIVPGSVIRRNDQFGAGGDSSAVQFLVWQEPSHASEFSLASDGTITYLQDPGWSGSDSFMYLWYRNGYCSQPGTVTIDPLKTPILADDTYHVDADVTGDPGSIYPVLPGRLPFDSTAACISSGICGILTNDQNIDRMDTPTDPPTFQWTTAPENGGLGLLRDSGTTAHGGTVWMRQQVARDAFGQPITDADGNPILIAASTGQFVYRPAPGFVGQDAFYYRITDGNTFALGSVDAPLAAPGSTLGVDYYKKVWAKVTLDVQPRSPLASVSAHPDTVAVVEDTPTGIAPAALIANDEHAANIRTIQSIDTNFSRPSSLRLTHGTLGIIWASTDLIQQAAINFLSYTPDPDYVGYDAFSYEIRGVAPDGSLEFSTSSVQLIVSNVDDPPVANGDRRVVHSGETVTIPVAANDTDPDGDLDPTSVRLLSGGSDWTVNPDGTISFAASSTFYGARFASYDIADARGVRATAGITVRVTPLNPDTYTTDEDTPLDVGGAGVQANDTPYRGSEPVTVSIVGAPVHGDVTLQPDGSFHYVPDPDFAGTDTFSYQANGGDSAYVAADETATVTITVRPVNDPPTVSLDRDCSTVPIFCSSAFDDREINENGFIQLRGFVQDVDPSFSGTLTIAWGDGQSDSYAYPCLPGLMSDCPQTIWFPPTFPSIGAVSRVYFDLSHRYADDPAGDAAQYPITVTADDGTSSGSADAAATVANLAPSLSLLDDCGLCIRPHSTLTIPAGGTATLRGRVIDPGADPVRLDVDWGDGLGGLYDQTCSGGTACPDAWAQAQHFCDPQPPFGGGSAQCGFYAISRTFTTVGTYHVTIQGADGDGGSTPLLETDIHVTRDNAPPSATDDDYNATEDTALVVNATDGVLANDTDPDAGETLSASILTQPAHGDVSDFAADGSFTYTPDPDANGPDSFTYQVCDSFDACDSATVRIAIAATPDAPVARDDVGRTNEDTALTVVAPGVLGNDTDADGDTLRALVVIPPLKGTLTLHPDGSYTYQPNADANGLDRFDYQACDLSGRCSRSTVNLTVDAVNDPPVAADDLYLMDQDSLLFVVAPGALRNDHDIDSSILTWSVTTPPLHGDIAANADGSFLYTPDAGFFGFDSLQYQASDGSASSNVATVRIKVNEKAKPPIATTDGYAATEDTTLTVGATDGVLANDSDPNGDAITATLVTGPAHGSLTFHADGSFTYVPVANANGTETFTYRAVDGGGLQSATTTVTIRIAAVNDAPTADAESYTTAEDTTLTVTAGAGLLVGDTDVDGDSLSAVLVSGPAHGSLNLNANGAFSYSPAQNYNGPDSFTYRASDGSLSSAVTTVSLTVTSVNDLPTIAVAGGSCLSDSDPHGTIVVALGDVETAAGSLTLTAASSATKVVPANGVAISGSGASRTVTITGSAKQTGTSTITVTVRDANGGTSQVAINVVVGGAKNGTLTGVVGTDLIFGLAGANTIIGGPAGETAIDILCGGSGADTIRGGGGNDVLAGGSGADTLEGGDGADTLDGGGGVDILRGQNGDDVLRGGAGGDSFSGGPGTDSYADFRAAEGDTAVEPAP